MSIENKDWHAHNNKMPGSEGLIVSGKVTVPSSGTVPILVKREIQDKSPGMRLELILEQSGIDAAVMTEKDVRLFVPNLSEVTHVEIFYKEALLVRIDEVPTAR